MATKTQATARQETDRPALAFDIRPGLEANQRLFRAFTELQAGGLERMVRMSEEMMRFVDRRLQSDRALLDSFSAPPDPARAIEAWNTFLEGAMRDYADEYQRLMRLFAQEAGAATSELQAQLRDAVSAAVGGVGTGPDKDPTA